MVGFFSSGQGRGEDVAYGQKLAGILIHTLREGNGLPVANCTTAANGNEREQLIPLIDSTKCENLKTGPST